MTKVNSKAYLVSELLYSGCFEVPWHQRYYDWKREQVEELLSDLKDALDTKKTCYFLGSIMLVKPSVGAPHRINDGQQRLITLSLIIAAFCRRFARQRPRDSGRETLAMRALFDRRENQTSQLSDASRYEPRIEPPRSDKSKYFQIVRGHDIGTNGLLTDAWNAIDIFIEGMSKSTMQNFFDFLMERVEVSVLDIPTDVDANSVFEALNARGKPLDDVDLIRNRLYSYFSEADDAVRRETVHENLEATRVIGRNTRKVEDYFRCYLQCRYGYLQKTRFYRDARTAIETTMISRNPADYVFRLVEGLGRRESTELFRAITSSRVNPSLEQSLPTVSGKRTLSVLLGELQGYTVSYPLVFALLHRFITGTGAEEKRKIGQIVVRSLRNLTSFVMRTAFVAPKFEPSRFETAFANCAKNVFEASGLTSLDIMDELESNDEWSVINDTNFIRRMAEMEFRDDKKVLRYLFAINARSQRGSDALRKDMCSVEHVLPRSEMYWKGWPSFPADDSEKWVYRPGNMVVVTKRENRSEAEYNSNFAAKKRAFVASTLQMPRSLAVDYDDWTPEAVEKRSRTLAQEAATIWRFIRRSARTP